MNTNGRVEMSIMKTKISSNRWLLASVLSLAATFPALAGEEDHLGQSQSPLISDVVVTEAQQEQLGLLQMSANGKGCSASLLTNSWVLSASHCLDAKAMRVPGNVQLNGNWGAHAQFGNADYIYRSWGLEDRGYFYDFSLIHLQNPMRVNGQTTGYIRELSELSLNDMNHVNLAVYGRGINVLAAANAQTGAAMPSSGDNKFRSFVFTVNRLEPTLFWYPKGPKGEMVGGGDSGGPSFETTRGVPRIAGVHALCHADCLPGKSCPATDSWTWVSNISECADAPVGTFGSAIHDFMKQSWNPANPVQTVQVPHTEGQVAKDMLLGYIDTLPWDYTRRAAQQMCRNRGFDFGFLDGNAQPGVRYQARCVGAATGGWFDAGPGDMAKINDKFGTIVQTGWAQGARAANDMCKNRNPAFVGGLFTGFEVKTQPNGGFADQRDGVWCFNNSNATWLDSTQAELAAQGTPIGDLNNTSWAVAGRAAVEYCRKKFYPGGGFFNGHQLADKRGVVCLGPNSVYSQQVKAVDDARAARNAAVYQPKTTATSGISRGALMTEAAGARQTSAIQPGVATPVPVVTAADLEQLRAKGASLANSDPLSRALRDRTADGAPRRGFDIGMGVWAGNTAPGPGKQRVHDALAAAEQPGFDIAAAFSLPHNKYAALASVGAAIGNRDPAVGQARNAENDVFYWLGFDIASGIFGDPAAGSLGNTATGPGSLGIRNELNAAGQRGFNASTALHFARKYR
jgi:hypothetical protein